MTKPFLFMSPAVDLVIRDRYTANRNTT